MPMITVRVKKAELDLFKQKKGNRSWKEVLMEGLKVAPIGKIPYLTKAEVEELIEEKIAQARKGY